jgi:hypothetical protein
MDTRKIKTSSKHFLVEINVLAGFKICKILCFSERDAKAITFSG